MSSRSFAVQSIDHVVLTVASIQATVDFYTEHLGMTHETFVSGDGAERHALNFGSQKINLHLSGHEFEPKASRVQPGSGDLCFITQHPIDEVLSLWKGVGIEVSAIRSSSPMFLTFTRHRSWKAPKSSKEQAPWANYAVCTAVTRTVI